MNLFRINFTRGCDKFTINFRATKRFNQQDAQREKKCLISLNCSVRTLCAMFHGASKGMFS